MILDERTHEWLAQPTRDPRSLMDSTPGPFYVYNAEELCDLLDRAYMLGDWAARKEIAEQLGLG